MDTSTDISAYGCFKRAAYARKDAGHRGSEYLLYSLLELRFCIERYLFETLALLHDALLSPEKKVKVGEWGANGLRAAILKMEPDFLLKLRFINLCRQADPRLQSATSFSGDLPIPELKEMGTLYGKIGNYLHAHRCNNTTHFDPGTWEKISSLVDEGVAHMERFAHTPHAVMKLNESGIRLFNALKNGETTEEATLASLRADRL